jgi:hypothetical protein
MSYRYKFSGYYVDRKEGLTYYHFKPINDKMNTTIKIGWEHLGTDIIYGYLDKGDFQSVGEIVTTLELGWERRQRELNGTQQEYLDNLKNKEVQ